MTFSLDGKYGFVSGAASGVGLETAKLLADRSISGIAAIDIDADGLDRLASELEKRGVHCMAMVVDVRDSIALKDAYDSALTEFGALHYAHNNAGCMGGTPVFPNSPVEKIERVVAINYTSVAVATQLAFHAIAASGGGSILNTSSGGAITPSPRDPIYAGAKAGINQMVLSCAGPFAENNVRINAICPGVIDTPIITQNNEPRDWIEDEMARRDWRFLTPEEVASRCVEILTDETTVGQIIEVRNPSV